MSEDTTLTPSRGMPLASVGQRLGAYMVDGLIVTAVVMLTQGGVWVGAASLGFSVIKLFTAAALVGALLYVGFFYVTLGRRGWTPGQLILGLRVVDPSTMKPIGIGRAFLRQIILGVLGPVNVAQLFTIPSQPQRQGWHDLVVRSIVIGRTRGLPTSPAHDPDMGQPRSLAHGPHGPDPWTAPRVPDLSSAPPTIPATSQQPGALAGGSAGAPGPDGAPRSQTAPPPAAVEAPPGWSPSPSPPTEPIEAPPRPEPAPQVGAGDTGAVGQEITPPPLDAAVQAGLTTARPQALRSTTQWTLSAGDRSRTVSDTLLVGRDPDPQLAPGAHVWVIQDDELTVSKTHAMFGLDDSGRVWVEDLGSTNGTSVADSGGRRTLATHQRHVLEDRDELLIGELQVTVKREVA